MIGEIDIVITSNMWLLFNIEIIIEVAAMNFRAKKMGYDATQTFDNNLTSLISEHSKEDTNKVPHND